jgi:predicted phage-related endonuclease
MIPAADIWEIASTGEWLQRRQGLVTASRVAALFDADPYMSRDDLGALMQGIPTGAGDTPAMRRGRIFEAAIVAALHEEHPDWAITRATTFHWIDSLRLGCTPDAWATIEGVPAIVQCKTASPEVWEKWGHKPPLGYLLQTLTEMIIAGRQVGVLAVMVMNPSYPVYEFAVSRHPAAEARILAAVAQWWLDYDEGRIAAPAPSDGLTGALDDGSVIDLSDNNYIVAMVPERQELKASVSVAWKRLADIDDAIKDAMGAASTAHVPGYTLTWRRQHRKEILIPAKVFRVLRIAPSKETSP